MHGPCYAGKAHDETMFRSGQFQERKREVVELWNRFDRSENKKGKGSKMEAMRRVVKEKRFWVASFLLAWAAALQGHMMWMQRQDAFKQKFPSNPNSDQAADS